MKLLQLSIGILCISTFIGQSSAENEMTLNTLIFKNINETTETIDIIFTPVVKLTENDVDHTLSFIDASTNLTKANILDLKSITPATDIGNNDQKIPFDIHINKYPTIIGKGIKLLLTSHLKAGGVAEGHVNVNITDPPVVPGKGTITVIDRRLARILPGKDKCELRVSNEIPSGFTISGGDLDDFTCAKIEETACYFKNYIVPKNTTFTVCKNIAIAKKVVFQQCSEEFPLMEDIAKGFTTVDSVTVDYKTNKIKISTTKTVTETDSWELVLYTDSVDPYVKAVTGGFDNIEGDIHKGEVGDHTVLLVGTTAADKTAKEYRKHLVADVELSPNLLGSAPNTIIEINVKNIQPRKFHMSRNTAENKPELDISYKEVDVDCTEILEDDICRGYFVEMKPGTYIITVNTDKDNIIKYMSNEVDLPSQLESRKGSSARNIGVTWQQDSSHADAVFQVCYNAPENKLNNTRYEAIILDGHGHWTKIYQSRHYEEPISCFSPVNLLTSSLKISEDTKLTLVVVERELSGYQVLASGQADIDLAALRMSKANQDSSSEGGSTSTLAIVGAAIAGIACLMALVAAAILFVMKRRRNNDGLQYPLQRSTIEDTNVINGLDNLNSIY